MRTHVVVLCLLASAAARAEPAPFAQKTLEERVAFFASKELAGRVPGTKGDIATRAAIVERWTALGLAPTEQAFTAGKARTANVLATLKGSDDEVGDEIVLVGAHHDHLGDGHLGANDDASGIAALLAIAEAEAGRASGPKRTIVFAAWGAEEEGELGSQFFAEHPTIDLDKVVEYINLDMVGSYDSSGLVAAMGTFPKLPARTLLAGIKTKLHVSLGGRASRSDHEAFCARGIPYVFFWTPDRRCYHETCDTPANLDGKHLAEIARIAGALVDQLADTSLDLAGARAELGCLGKKNLPPSSPRKTGEGATENHSRALRARTVRVRVAPWRLQAPWR